MRTGQSLVEVLIGIALGALLIIAAVAAIAPALQTNTKVNQVQAQAQLAKELGDNVRAWAAGNWQTLVTLATTSANSYYLDTSQSPFVPVGGVETVLLGGNSYQRSFYVDDVYRDSIGNVTTSFLSALSNISLIQQNGCSTTNASQQTCGFLSEITAGDLVVIAIKHSGSETVTSVTANTTDSIVAVSANPCTDPSNNNRGDIYYITNSAGGYTDFTVNLSGSTGAHSFRIWLHEYSGIDTSSPLDANVCNSQSSVGTGTDAVTSGNMTAGTARELVFGFGIPQNGTLSAGTGFIQLQSGAGGLSEYKIVNATGTYAATLTDNTSGDNTFMMGALFKAGTSLTPQGIYDPSTKKITINTTSASGRTGGVQSWAYGPNLNTGAYNTVPVVYGNYLYVLGGYSSGANTVVEYAKLNANGSIVSWTNTTPLPDPGIYDQAVVAYHGYIYNIGGVEYNVTSSVYYAKIQTNGSLGSWSRTTVLPTALRAISAAAYNGYMYVLGGRDNLGTQTSTVMYAPINSDGTLGSWTNTTQALNVGDDGAGIYKGYLYYDTYFAGPTVGPDYIAINANGALAGTWATTTGNGIIETTRGALGTNGFIYNVGKEVSTGNPTTTVAYVQASSNGGLGGSWQTTTPLLDAYKNIAYIGPPVAGNNGLYMIGGMDSRTSVGTTTTSYASFGNIASSSQLTNSFYVTRSQSNSFDQTDWSGGSGQTGPVTVANNQFSLATNTLYTTAGSITINPPPSSGIFLVESQLKTQSSGSSLGVSFGGSPSSGDLVVVGISAWDQTINTPNDNQGNTYNIVTSTSVAVGVHTMYIALYYAQNVSSNGGTFNVTGTIASTGAFTMAVQDYRGAATASVLDQFNSKSSGATASTTFSSGNVTTATNNELYVGLAAWANQENVSSTSNFSTVALQHNATNLQDIAFTQKISTATTTAATWKSDASDQYIAIIATFKPAQ